MSRLAAWVVCGVLATAGASGCAGYAKSVKVEERLQPAEASTQAPHGSVVTQRTTIVERRTDSPGLLSTTVRFIGDVLTLPFRLVGGLLQLVF